MVCAVYSPSLGPRKRPLTIQWRGFFRLPERDVKNSPIYHVTYRPNVKPLCGTFHKISTQRMVAKKFPLYTIRG